MVLRRRLPIVALAEPEECARAVAAHAARHGGMDGALQLAGIGIGGAFAEQDTKRIALQLDVNLRATLVVTQGVAPVPARGARSGDHARLDRRHDPDAGARGLRCDEGGADRVHGLAQPGGGGLWRPRDRDLAGVRGDADDRMDRASGRRADPARRTSPRSSAPSSR